MLAADGVKTQMKQTNKQLANCFPPQIDTVHPSESKSRRWKSLNTQDTSAPSVERLPSRDTPLVSGIANHARRPLLEELTPSRMSPRFEINDSNLLTYSTTEPPPPLLWDRLSADWEKSLRFKWLGMDVCFYGLFFSAARDRSHLWYTREKHGAAWSMPKFDETG